MASQNLDPKLHVVAASAWLLESLDLGDEDIVALHRQGFVSSERRGARMVVYKLRYRVQGRQRVKYLGTDADRAQHVEQLLVTLRRLRQAELNFRSLARETTKLLKESKQRLVPLVTGAGLHFHGRTIRYQRASRLPRRIDA